MIAKWFIAGALALLVMTCMGAAQSVPELLEKGIYTQETVGNLDAAIEIYRQILSSAPADRAYAAQAQYRLAQCLLQKGKEADAAKEFKKVIEGYPEEKDLAEKARESLLPLANYLEADYYDPVLGFSFTSPSPKWQPFGKTYRGYDGSSSIPFVSGYDKSGHGFDFASFDVRRSKMSSADTIGNMRDKLQARFEAWQKQYPNFRIRPDSVSTRELKGGQVLSFIADYSKPNELAKVIYGAWMESGRTEVVFFADMNAQDLERNQPIIEQILQSVKMP